MRVWPSLSVGGLGLNVFPGKTGITRTDFKHITVYNNLTVYIRYFDAPDNSVLYPVFTC